MNTGKYEQNNSSARNGHLLKLTLILNFMNHKPECVTLIYVTIYDLTSQKSICAKHEYLQTLK